MSGTLHSKHLQALSESASTLQIQAISSYETRRQLPLHAAKLSQACTICDVWLASTHTQ